MPKTQISVVVVIENRAQALPAMLSCLEKQTLPAACYEVIFVLYGCSSNEDLVLAEHHTDSSPMSVKCLHAPAWDEVRAKNLGAFNAQGEWLLFLDQDLLAGSRLLSTHLEIHRQRQVQAIIQGPVGRSKSLHIGSLTRWFLHHDKDLMTADKPDAPFYWSSRHCSLPRALFVAGGGFNESYESPRAADIDFLQRTMRGGCAAITLPGSHAFIWREAHFDEERKRFWRDGFDLYRLSKAQKNPEILYHFQLRSTRMRFRVDSVFIPFYIKACQNTPLDIRIHGRSCLHVFMHDSRRGAKDAQTE